MIISKLDAAKRQLEMAIKLYFKSSDPVAIHTLVSAAHEILMNLSNKEGKKSIIKQQMLSEIPVNKQADFKKALNKARNFFKHADKDHKDTIEFNPDANDRILWDGVEMYAQMTSSPSDITNVFHMRFVSHHPDIFPTIKDQMRPFIEYMKSTGFLDNKDEFFRIGQEAAFINHVS